MNRVEGFYDFFVLLIDIGFIFGWYRFKDKVGKLFFYILKLSYFKCYILSFLKICLIFCLDLVLK